jgi:glutamyl-tRNA synthetase
MHIGNLRTALYAYLLARANNGSFILRIEDTDKERLVSGALDTIYNTLRNTGLFWDEGPDIGGKFGPYVQSERLSIYKEYAQRLIELGEAYYCFCNKERLDEVRLLQKCAGAVPKYDGFCRTLTKEQIAEKLAAKETYVTRQKIPQFGQIIFEDKVFGGIVVENSTLDDQILIKTDGMPTYNFANVVDDHLMGITHVIRGSEYLSSTPKYNLLYRAFGWEIPQYIHCSPVMRNTTEKLSKRKGDFSFEDLAALGYLNEAILNYIALLGWSPKSEQEIFTLENLKKEFNVTGISKSPAIFDIKKLNYINSQHIKALSADEFHKLALPFIRISVKNKQIDTKLVATLLQNRTEFLKSIPEQVNFIDNLPMYNTDLFINKKMKTDQQSSLEVLNNVLPILEQTVDFSILALRNLFEHYITDHGLKNGFVLWPVRVALSGKEFTPGGAIELAAILGKQEAIKRLKFGVKKLTQTTV